MLNSYCQGLNQSADASFAPWDLAYATPTLAIGIETRLAFSFCTLLKVLRACCM